jgi:hypothetical protein
MTKILVVAAGQMVLRVARVETLGIPLGSPHLIMAVMVARYLPRPRRIVLSWVVAVGPDRRTIPTPVKRLALLRVAVAVGSS